MIRINVHPPRAGEVLTEVTLRDDQGNDNIVGSRITAPDLHAIVDGLKDLVQSTPTQSGE